MTATAREQEVHDAVHRLGIENAARSLKVSRATVVVTLARYHQKVCVPRIAALEAEVAALRAKADLLADMESDAPVPWGRLEAKLDKALSQRQPVAIDHRRIADGGRSVRDQVREARRLT